ncbi:GUN4 domain-containing protein [Iningainema sp. BLCCT55]|uniref:GUN4 domain-containing protein n=2 Tax=Iningainema TaxID=1932705 RepID=A0A8J7BXG8_9CYAN|nr:serine/threonine-protein kinase [Iningainema tapete]MBD2773777.1 GUN4 domain-containing protein [Iningainema tapete BLCC-T55]
MFWAKGQLIHNGKYQIERMLGGGGFAVTYQAIHTTLNRLVVIKTPNQNVQNDPDYPKYVERFKKEAQMLAECCTDSHPHIVQVFDLFEEDGRHCLVMQYIPGESLWQFVQRIGALSETEAVKYIHQIGIALVEVHKKGVWHLDVTPPNIMLSFDSGLPNSGKAVLIDFGIAGDMSPPSTLSRSFGNKAFAPYELISKGIRHPTVDVYCLAASLYYAVTGQIPTKSLNRKFESEKLSPPKQLVPSLSDAVNQAIWKGMALEAKNRPQTMQEWLNLLPENTPPPTPRPKLPWTQPLRKWILAIIVLLALFTALIPVISQLTTQNSPLPINSSTPKVTKVDYSNLENLLRAKKWKEADEETSRLMLKVAGREKEGRLDEQSISNFPCNELRTIDQLWVKYSNERFGFSVQKRIWDQVGGMVSNRGDTYEKYTKLADRVGWRKNTEWQKYNQLNFSLEAPVGHLPTITEHHMNPLPDFFGDVVDSSLMSISVKCNI